MSQVQMQGITKRYGDFTAIKNLDLTVRKGSFTALLGPSGCGKSTLLRMIAGLEPVTQGRVHIDSIDVTELAPAKRGIAMVFQSYALYPHMTVRQNIAFSLAVAHCSKAEQAIRADRIADMLQLTPLMDRKPAQLSGGQRQRVAIGRALVREPEVFLFDEPLSNLDATLRVQMRLELARLHKDLGTTMIYVTHDQVEAMTLADNIVVLDQGSIAQVGSPLELYDRPANRFVASFIDSPAMNCLSISPTQVIGNAFAFDLGGLQKLVVNARHAADNATDVTEIGIRPEYVEIVAANDAQAHLSGKVLVIERLGNMTIIYVETMQGTVVIEAASGVEVAGDQLLGLRFDASRVHLFKRSGQVA